MVHPLFWLVCLPTRYALARNAHLTLVRAFAVVVSFRWLTGLERATTGFFGGHAWWARYRRLHGALWGLYALTADALYLYADTLAGALFGAAMAVTAVA
jgi:hypothetical protein